MASTGEVWRLGRRPALDGLRGVAVLLVIADHAGFLPEPVGGIGVVVFFVLSGFLITRVIVEATDNAAWSFRTFIGNRAARLLPALLAMVLVVVTFCLSAGVDPVLVLRAAARAVFYVENLLPSGPLSGLFGHTWSLAVEEQFYLWWPLALPLIARSRRPLAWLAGLVLVSLALRADEAFTHLLPFTFAFKDCYALLIGCGLALSGLGRVRAPRGLFLVASAVLVVVIAVGPHLPRAAYSAPVLAVAPAALLVWVAASGASLLERPSLRFTGRISYALYLWHLPLLTLAGQNLGGVSAIPVLVVAYGLATASTLLMEEPLRRAWRLRGGEQRRDFGVVAGLHGEHASVVNLVDSQGVGSPGR